MATVAEVKAKFEHGKAKLAHRKGMTRKRAAAIIAATLFKKYPKQMATISAEGRKAAAKNRLPKSRNIAGDHALGREMRDAYRRGDSTAVTAAALRDKLEYTGRQVAASRIAAFAKRARVEKPSSQRLSFPIYARSVVRQMGTKFPKPKARTNPTAITRVPGMRCPLCGTSPCACNAPRPRFVCPCCGGPCACLPGCLCMPVTRAEEILVHALGTGPRHNPMAEFIRTQNSTKHTVVEYIDLDDKRRTPTGLVAPGARLVIRKAERGTKSRRFAAYLGLYAYRGSRWSPKRTWPVFEGGSLHADGTVRIPHGRPANFTSHQEYLLDRLVEWIGHETKEHGPKRPLGGFSEKALLKKGR